jgi:glycosyltransferase involved in cell wall biosynthesis
LRSLYEREHIDLVHFHSPVAGGQAIPAVAARLAGVNATVATFHQIQDRRLSTKSRAVSYVTLSLFVDGIMAVSNGVRETLVRAAGAPRSRITVVHNGIEAPEIGAGVPALPRRNGDILVGYFGRLSPEKGVPGLLEALSLLAPRCPQARAIIVGDGPDRAMLEAMAVALGIADRVQFLGFRADARQLMEQVDVVAHVPVYEGFGIVVLEAMAAGRPVVGNNAPGGVSEIVVHGETGLIVPAGSAEDLARALAYLVESPRERARLGQNGRIRQGQHFSARGMVERIEASYASALRRRVGLSHAERVRGVVSIGR